MRRWLKGDAATVVVVGRYETISSIILSSVLASRRLEEYKNVANRPETAAIRQHHRLLFLLYCLAKNPEDAEKIYAELADVDPFDLTVISTLSHLNGAINEAMPLCSVATTTVSRQTPLQGVMLGDRFIPGDAKVLVPRCVIFNRTLTLLILNHQRSGGQS